MKERDGDIVTGSLGCHLIEEASEVRRQARDPALSHEIQVVRPDLSERGVRRIGLAVAVRREDQKGLVRGRRKDAHTNGVPRFRKAQARGLVRKRGGVRRQRRCNGAVVSDEKSVSVAYLADQQYLGRSQSEQQRRSIVE